MVLSYMKIGKNPPRIFSVAGLFYPWPSTHRLGQE